MSCQGDGDHVALVRGYAVRLQLGDETRVLGVLEQLAHFLVLFRDHLDVVFSQATLAVPADLSERGKEGKRESLDT